MADKDFVVKNGLIVNGSILAVNTATSSVGINTLSPDAALKVVGTANVTSDANFGANVAARAVVLGGAVVVNATAISGNPDAFLGTANASTFRVGTSSVINAAGAFVTTVNSATMTVASNLTVGAVVANTTAIAIGANFVANATQLSVNNMRILANGTFGTPGQVMISDGTSMYWGVTSGYAGSLGYTGSQGLQGELGYAGSQGPRGYSGSQGGPGLTGDRGFTGSIGFSGSQGVTGFVGSLGFTGSVGFAGSQGAGFTGSQGSVGFTGSSGAYAAIGYTGSQGATGSAGALGPIGYTGSRGATGATGATGPQGPAGSTGATGYTGSAGPVAGSSTYVIFNDGGVAGGSPNFTFNKTTNQLNAGVMITSGGMQAGTNMIAGAALYYGYPSITNGYIYNASGYHTWQGGGSSIWQTGTQQQMNPGGRGTLIVKNTSYHVTVDGDFYVGGGPFTPGGVWIVPSDVNMKTDIVTVDKSNSLSRIMSLNPVDYSWKTINEKLGRTAGKKRGFIAQEVEKIYPAQVTTTTDPDTKQSFKALGLGSHEFFADLVATNQYLVNKIEELQTKLKKLEKDLGV